MNLLVHLLPTWATFGTKPRNTLHKPIKPDLLHGCPVLNVTYGVNLACRDVEAPRLENMAKVINSVSQKLAVLSFNVTPTSYNNVRTYR